MKESIAVTTDWVDEPESFGEYELLALHVFANLPTTPLPDESEFDIKTVTEFDTMMGWYGAYYIERELEIDEDTTTVECCLVSFQNYKTVEDMRIALLEWAEEEARK